MEIEQKGKFGVTHIFEAKMGNRTKATIRDYQGKREGVTYANEILQDDLVKISGPNQVEKCAAGDTPIGIAMADYEHEGALPKTSANWGNYSNNAYVRVETFGKVIKTVTLEAANSAISAGNYIKLGSTTAGAYDKSSDPTNNIALESASANSGAQIKVLFGVVPM